MLEYLVELDKTLFLLFNATLSSPILDFLMPRLTNGAFWIAPAVIAFGLFIYKRRKEALIMLLLAGITVALSDPISSQILKKLFARPRPCHPDLFIEGGRFLLGMKRSLSFPSSHAMNIFAQAMVWSCVYRRCWVYFFSFAALIGYTRVYCGVHFPFDVLAGAVGGCIVGLIVFNGYVLVKKFIEKMTKTSE